MTQEKLKKAKRDAWVFAIFALAFWIGAVVFCCENPTQQEFKAMNIAPFSFILAIGCTLLWYLSYCSIRKHKKQLKAERDKRKGTILTFIGISFMSLLFSSCDGSKIPVGVITLDGRTHIEVMIPRSKVDKYHINDRIVIESDKGKDWKISKKKINDIQNKPIYTYNRQTVMDTTYKYRVVKIESIGEIGKGIYH